MSLEIFQYIDTIIEANPQFKTEDYLFWKLHHHKDNYLALKTCIMIYNNPPDMASFFHDIRKTVGKEYDHTLKSMIYNFILDYDFCINIDWRGVDFPDNKRSGIKDFVEGLSDNEKMMLTLKHGDLFV